MLAVETITSAEALAALEPEWWTLWRATPEATPFQSPAWLVPWWQVFAPGRLLTVTLRRGGLLVGLAPFYLEDGPMGLRLLPLGIGISDHLDILLAPGDDEAETAMGSALASLPDWTSIEFEEMAPMAAAFRLNCPEGYRDFTVPQSACPVAAVARQTDDSGLPMSLPGKRRQTFRRKLTAARALGEVELVTAEPLAFLQTLATLHGERWESRGESGVLADPRVMIFHRLTLPRLVESGLARPMTMSIGGRVAGALYWLTWRDRIASYLSGFSPRFTAPSPMTVLCGEGFCHAAAAGHSELSFLRGQEPYKYLWGAEDRWNTHRTWQRG